MWNPKKTCSAQSWIHLISPTPVENTINKHFLELLPNWRFLIQLVGCWLTRWLILTFSPSNQIWCRMLDFCLFFLSFFLLPVWRSSSHIRLNNTDLSWFSSWLKSTVERTIRMELCPEWASSCKASYQRHGLWSASAQSLIYQQRETVIIGTSILSTFI